jgi:hypothetical protein
MGASKDGWWPCRRSFVLDEPGPRLVDEDLLMVDPPLETGVRGGEWRVTSWEPNDWVVRCVPGRGTVDMDGTRMPKSRSSRLARCDFKTLRVHGPRNEYRTICNTAATAHRPNHTPSNMVGAVFKTLWGRLLRRTTSHTSVTPETHTLTAPTTIPPTRIPQVFDWTPTK